MGKPVNLQDVFLNAARKDKIVVNIILNNGFQYKGLVEGFDSFIVILDCEDKQHLIYKHAISSIVPNKPIAIFQNPTAE